ncbi:hypothetical protein, partial [Vibrio rumoiensis]|uniref:hypothetical protein n=1 Tax=Vibrio rumoiensis TaxID=76258 RepID=UPI00058492E4
GINKSNDNGKKFITILCKDNKGISEKIALKKEIKNNNKNRTIKRKYDSFLFLSTSKDKKSTVNKIINPKKNEI